MDKQRTITWIWAMIIFIGLAIGANHAIKLDSNSIWFLIPVLAIHTFYTVKIIPPKNK